MKRRDSLKNMALGGLGFVMPKNAEVATPSVEEALNNDNIVVPGGRTKEEAVRDAQLKTQKFFTPHELRTVTILSDIILPADAKSGSASQAGVPAFIEFMMKDMPQQQTPMRGGLMWLDAQCRKRYQKRFVECTRAQQIEVVDDIAYPQQAKAEMQQGVAFFNMMRNLVMTGFYTTAMGFKDLGYIGNQPNTWAGVPEAVYKKFGFDSNEG
jgi:gluconate 2-dehydrogenase gamma chain